MSAAAPDRLEVLLAEVGQDLAYPGEDIAPLVVARLGSTSPPRPAVLRPVFGRPRWQRAIGLASAAAVLAAGVIVATPPARRAVAGWLGIGGVQVRVTGTPPPASLRPFGQGLDLGTPTTLVGAASQLDFDPILPTDPSLGPPDLVTVRPLLISEELFMVWKARAGLPASRATGVGLLVSEFKGRENRDVLGKFAAAGLVRFVRVGSDPGFWIEGSHEVGFLDEHGNFVQDTLRVSDSALLWEHDGVLLRIESALPEAEVIRIAETFR
jgi:hypothetical protein